MSALKRKDTFGRCSQKGACSHADGLAVVGTAASLPRLQPLVDDALVAKEAQAAIDAINASGNQDR